MESHVHVSSHSPVFILRCPLFAYFLFRQFAYPAWFHAQFRVEEPVVVAALFFLFFLPVVRFSHFKLLSVLTYTLIPLLCCLCLHGSPTVSYGYVFRLFREHPCDIVLRCQPFLLNFFISAPSFLALQIIPYIIDAFTP